MDRKTVLEMAAAFIVGAAVAAVGFVLAGLL